MARLLRWALRSLVALLVLTLVAALVAVWLVRRSFPVVSGEVPVDVLDAPVEVYRDGFGVPHLYARSADDLFRAQGYVHAQDRFWQMDFWRHVGTGRLAELFGESEVERDRFIRTLGWEEAARADLEVLDGETRRYLEAYADGVNAYLEERSGTGASLEYAFLTLRRRGYEPEPWTPVHTLVWLKVMAWDLRSNVTHETERAILSADLPADRVRELWPPYPGAHPTILGGAPGGEASSTSEPPLPGSAVPVLRRVDRGLTALGGVLGSSRTGMGSNSWVISGARTASGKPLLANDPHLGPQMPSIWYEMGLHCRTVTPDCPFDVAGFTFPGVPAVIVGHNDRIAWGVTNFNADVADLYVEKVHPEDADTYELDGQWVEMDVDEEVIEVAGGDPVVHAVRRTVHGPVISDVSGQIDGVAPTGRDTPQAHAVSLRWSALEPSRTARAVLELNRARNWSDFRAALAYWDVPSQNFVYADVDGNIGYQVPGRIPVRRSGDGRWPVAGWTGQHAWTDWVPYEDLPRALNPPDEYVVTANNLPRRDHPVLLGTDWAYGFRAQRIIEMIDRQGSGFTVEDLAAMQADTTNLNARQLVPVLADLDLSADPDLRRARDLIVSWDRTQAADSGPAVLFNAFWRALLSRTFHDELPEAHLPDGSGRWFEVVHRLLSEPGNPWWDDSRTSDQIETRNDMLIIALRTGLEEVERELGSNPEAWRWGDLHELTLEHPSFGTSGIGLVERVFNRGPYAVGGGDAIVNATGWQPPDGYGVNAVPSFRMVVDLADFDRSTAIHISGQSGHAFHPHYDDMAPLWADNRTLPFPFTRGAVVGLSRERLHLVPE